MNERPTLETDAFFYPLMQKAIAHDLSREAIAFEAEGFARRLERERNEAREENARLREVVKEAHDAIERLLDKGHDDRCAWINYANAACTCGDWAGHIVLRNLKPFVAP